MAQFTLLVAYLFIHESFFTRVFWLCSPGRGWVIKWWCNGHLAVISQLIAAAVEAHPSHLSAHNKPQMIITWQLSMQEGREGGGWIDRWTGQLEGGRLSLTVQWIINHISPLYCTVLYCKTVYMHTFYGVIQGSSAGIGHTTPVPTYRASA